MEIKKALFIILLLTSLPSGAKCPCGSIASGFNYLGDSSLNIETSSLDDPSQSAYLANKLEESVADSIDREKKSSTEYAASIISLDLNDSSHIDIVLYPSGIDLFGNGSLTQEDSIEPAGAVGIRKGDRLAVDVVTLSARLYRFDLQENESRLFGDCTMVDPNGTALIRAARGYQIENIVIGKGE